MHKWCCFSVLFIQLGHHTHKPLSSQLAHASPLCRHVSFMRICDFHIFCLLAHFWHISTKCTLHIFPNKLTFSTAILILFVFLLPIYIRFCCLNHFFANRMAPSMCPDPCGTRWGSWFKQFCTIFPHISAAYLVFMWSAYFLKCCIKLTCLTMSQSPAERTVMLLLLISVSLLLSSASQLPSQRREDFVARGTADQ